MRVPVVCFECYKTTTPPPAGSVSLEEVQDSGVYSYRCPNGHSTTAYLREERFEILYQSAAYAVLDGYYREAVASFTGAFEAFCEFYLRVLGRKKEVAPDLCEESLKRLVAQSERVLGAYTMTYTLEHRIPPPALPQNQVTFRNKVIHRGKFPTREEAIAYGQDIADVIYPVLSYLRQHERKYITDVVDTRINKLCQATNSRQTVIFPGIINIHQISPDRQPILKESLEKLESNRKSRGW